jgi:hypothetical protein
MPYIEQRSAFCPRNCAVLGSIAAAGRPRRLSYEAPRCNNLSALIKIQVANRVCSFEHYPERG